MTWLKLFALNFILFIGLFASVFSEIKFGFQYKSGFHNKFKESHTSILLSMTEYNLDISHSERSRRVTIIIYHIL